MIIGFKIRSLGTFTKKEFATLLKRRVIFEDQKIADNVAEVISQGFELNVFCEHLNDNAALEQHNVDFSVLDIEESDDTSLMVNAVDFKVSLLYKDAVTHIELQPTEYISLPNVDIEQNFQLAVERGLVRIYHGKFIERIFSDEFDYEFY